MPNYIRSQSPWLAAADAMNGVANPLVAGWMQQQQIRAQMQQHADQMGIAQGRLNLEQQDQALHAPMYQAQTAHWNAAADEQKAKVAELNQLLSLAQQGQRAKTASYTQQNGFQPGVPTMQNAQIGSQGDLLGALAAAAILGQGSGATALNNEQQPVKMNLGQTGFVGGQPKYQGAMSVPFGNTLMQGTTLPNTNPPTLQQGQFSPKMGLDASTIAKNWAGVAQAADAMGLPPEVVAGLFGRGTNAPAPTLGAPSTNSPVRISSKDEWMRLPSGTQYIGPDGLPATKQ